MKLANTYDDVDGLLFPFYHFWGDYNHYRHTRRTYANEIRAFKNYRKIRSYRDSQGFRKFCSLDSTKKGEKLKVLKTNIPIYHYSYVRNPKVMSNKSNVFHHFYHDDEWIGKNGLTTEFDYNKVDRLTKFIGSYPKFMNGVIKNKDWDFSYDPSKTVIKLKDRILYPFEKYFGYRLFEYKNYLLKDLSAEE